MKKYSCILGVFSLCLLVSRSSTYNLEDRLPLFKRGPPGSKFGFSVEMHRTTTDDQVGVSGTLLLAGAPTATSVRSPASDAPVNPGGVFYCPVTTDPNDCSRVNLDEGNDSNTTDRSRIIVRESSGQWIGVSLRSLGPGKKLVTCGHRLSELNYTEALSTDERQRLCGKCYLLKSSPAEVEEILPGSSEFPSGFVSNYCDRFSTDRKGRHENYLDAYGYSQAGTSMAALDEQFVVGAPGTWKYRGAIFNIDMQSPTSNASEFKESPTCFFSERYDAKNRTRFCKRLPLGPNQPHMGFSVAMSRAIEQNSKELYYAAGAPTANLTGVVLIFTKMSGQPNLVVDPSNAVIGEKIDSSFGFAVAFADCNGDKLDDLIVGAPQYFEYSRKSEVGGAVYVYLNDPTKGFRDVSPKLFFGPDSSYFGHALAALGDLDQDGYEDFAVGAPYEESNGAVHIFRGGPKGPKESQVIKGSRYVATMKDLVGFGASLSGHIDADGNNYPDILVGTRSDSMVLLRSRPVISVHSNVNFIPGDIKDGLDLESKSCKFRNARYTCFNISFCLSYEVHHEYPAGISLKTYLRLDTIRKEKKLTTRLRFDSPSGRDRKVKQKFRLASAGKKVCSDEYTVYFLNGIDDKLTDLKIDLDFDTNMKEIESEKVGSPISDMRNNPALDADLGNSKSEIIRIKNNCGDDGCQSNLQLSAVMPEEIVKGRDSFVFVNVTASNDGEEAHQAVIRLQIPGTLDFVDYQVESGPEEGIGCSSLNHIELTEVICLIGNPYLSGRRNTIAIQLSTRRLELDTNHVDMTIKGSTTSSNPPITPISLKSSVVGEAFLSLSWSSQPDQVRYTQKEILGESGMKSTDDVGPHLEFTFNVKNTASLPAQGTRLQVDLPVETSNGKWLLYLVNADIVGGKDLQFGNCSETYENSLHLELAEQDAASISSRYKRSVKDDTTEEEVPRAEALSSGSFADRLKLSCQDGKAICKTVLCDIPEIPPQTSVSAVLVMRLWEATFLEEYNSVDLVSVFTDAALSAIDSNYRIRGKTSGTLETIVDRDLNKTDIQAQFPWWYILIAAIVVCVIYFVAIILLFRCGYFKRKRFHRRDREDSYVVREDTNM